MSPLLMGYQLITYPIFAYLIIRTWILYGRKIPLTFLGLLVLGWYTVPRVLGSSGFPIFFVLLTIALLLIDRFKSVRWNSM
ncbi:MAG TPA: hypothetical protein VMB70_10590 [Terriglobia bacterium]|nr:hypothetical protein [Terriglobia bacterium]